MPQVVLPSGPGVNRPERPSTSGRRPEPRRDGRGSGGRPHRRPPDQRHDRDECPRPLKGVLHAFHAVLIDVRRVGVEGRDEAANRVFGERVRGEGLDVVGADGFVDRHQLLSGGPEVRIWRSDLVDRQSQKQAEEDEPLLPEE